MSARKDAATLLERALIGDAAKAGFAITIDSASATRWASVTFVGARHRLTIGGPDQAAVEDWLEGLAETDLQLRGHLVADLAVVDRSHADGRLVAGIEVLTVEEA